MKSILQSEKKCFICTKSFVVSEKIVAFAVKEKYHDKVIMGFKNVFGAKSFFDIISHDRRIYFLCIDPQTVKKIRKLCKTYLSQ